MQPTRRPLQLTAEPQLSVSEGQAAQLRGVAASVAASYPALETAASCSAKDLSVAVTKPTPISNVSPRR